MKVAHFVRYGPHQSGLYETTRDMCAAEIKMGLDSYIVDTIHMETQGEPRQTAAFDRGVVVNPPDKADDADVHVLHSGIPEPLFGKKPIVVVLHGAPEYVFHSEVMLHEKGDRGFSTILGYGRTKEVKSFVTLWKRHVPYWQSVLGEAKVSFVPCGVSLDEFKPGGEAEVFVTSGSPNIGYADSWRPTFFQDPFRVIQGVREYWKKDQKARLHLFGTPSGARRDVVWDRYILAVKRQGDFFGQIYELREGMDKVYRGLDILVTTNIDESRVVREALCCGTRVVAPVGAEFTEWTANIASPSDVAAAITAALEDNRLREVRANESSSRYDSKAMAEGMKAVYEKVAG